MAAGLQDQHGPLFVLRCVRMPRGDGQDAAARGRPPAEDQEVRWRGIAAARALLTAARFMPEDLARILGGSPSGSARRVVRVDRRLRLTCVRRYSRLWLNSAVKLEYKSETGEHRWTGKYGVRIWTGEPAEVEGQDCESADMEGEEGSDC